MGVKDLWTVLTVHAERKPICELRGRTVAIDLAGWVCESLNVVDYFVHPRHHLKNLFFRTCYLIWEEVTPVFVLEGLAPKLKSQVMEKRTEVQFRGVRPREKPVTQTQSDSQSSNKRTRFNQVLKQCENLLTSMGIHCVQGPGEAEAYCAFLNQKGLVDGIISQDSDCFAYGANRVFRNFSVSSQGALAAQGGAVDIYDMEQICTKMDFGQNKVIVMALLCGCDYCPGVGGIGRDSVIKLFNKYKNNEILKRLRSWRYEEEKYTALEMRVDDKTLCTNCGHLGRTQSHTKNGCGICRTNRGCDESLWKEERLSLKAELTLRKKALADPLFPAEDIIEEFQRQPKEVPKLDLTWRQPNVVKFIKQIGPLLMWTEIYCFQKFFPILTRWQVLNASRLNIIPSAVAYVTPKEIIKKRVVKGIPSLELLWQDEKGFFKGLIPDDQFQQYQTDNPKGIADLWTTVEPFNMIQQAYPSLVEAYIKSKEKPKKSSRKEKKIKAKTPENQIFSSLENLKDLVEATNEVSKTVKPKRQPRNKAVPNHGLQMIDKYLKQQFDRKIETPTKSEHFVSSKKNPCSTPLTKTIPFDLESEDECNLFDMSDIVNAIVEKKTFDLTSHNGYQLRYESMSQDSNLLINGANSSRCLDDMDILREKRSLSNSFNKTTYTEAKRLTLDDSFDVLVKVGYNKIRELNKLTSPTKNTKENLKKPFNMVDRFKQKQRVSLNLNTTNNYVNDNCEDDGVSNFFNSSFQQEDDVFEKIMEKSFAKYKLDDL